MIRGSRSPRCYGATNMLLVASLLSAIVSPLAMAISDPPVSIAAPQHASQSHSSGTLHRTLADFGHLQGDTLKTVRAEQSYAFTRSTAWRVLPTSSIQVAFQHSPHLLEGRSSLNVLLNGQILKTIPLTKANIAPTRLGVPIPPELLKDQNLLTFQVDQHYTNQCEDPFSAELWTTLLPETRLSLNFSPKPIDANLTRLPLPFVDPLDPRPASLGVMATPDSAPQTLTALAQVLTRLGQVQSWRPGSANWRSPDALATSHENLLLVGTPAENPAIAQLADYLPVKLSGEGSEAQWLAPKGQKIAPDDGLILLLAHPNAPEKAILIVTGQTSAGVAKAARLLSSHPAAQLLVGPYAIVTQADVDAAEGHRSYRQWSGYQTGPKTTFSDLGWQTQTVRGFTAPPVFLNWQLMPDVHIPSRGQPGSNAHLTLRYSYSSQIDPTQSKLEVSLNGKSLKSVPLNNPNGGMQESLAVTMPTADVLNYNDLKFQFYLFPEKVDLCKFVTDVHVWGTVHSNSQLHVPAEIRTPIPDVGLLNDGGYPYTAFTTLQETVIVMPDTPDAEALQVLTSVLHRLGRTITAGNPHSAVTVVNAAGFKGDLKDQNHLILIGNADTNTVIRSLKGRFHALLNDGGKSGLAAKSDEQALHAVLGDRNSGVIEAMLSPWNAKRQVLVITGATPEALNLAGQAFSNDALFAKLESGNLALIQPGSSPDVATDVKTLTHLKPGEARFVFEDELGPQKTDTGWPTWSWVIAGFFALVGLVTTLKFLFFRRKPS